ncbi:uncharacterized protein N7479_006302 [Penicillium vulpinum]|uniref:uncharacterized protein n=1 Tax=Penicillium vulpinum TaxID=29845 RepID=UPI0025483F6E|nr:uncharacterized protein N7479_006302 [Penicillium vulpinum]KAJ5959152.1 hypothetical protein N7479_006302 [Penicillium vulpinum]
MTKDIGPSVTTDIPAACDILLDRGSSALAFSELVLSIHSARTILCPAGLNHLDPIPPDMRGDDLPDLANSHGSGPMGLSHRTIWESHQVPWECQEWD